MKDERRVSLGSGKGKQVYCQVSFWEMKGENISYLGREWPLGPHIIQWRLGTIR